MLEIILTRMSKNLIIQSQCLSAVLFSPPRLICCHFPLLRCTHVRFPSWVDVGRRMKYMQQRQRRIDLQELFSSFPPFHLVKSKVSSQQLRCTLSQINLEISRENLIYNSSRLKHLLKLRNASISKYSPRKERVITMYFEPNDRH